jgi:hypothetical protein
MVGLVLPAEVSETGFGQLWRKGPVREDKKRNMKGEKKRKTARKKKEERRTKNEERGKKKEERRKRKENEGL